MFGLGFEELVVRRFHADYVLVSYGFVWAMRRLCVCISHRFLYRSDAPVVNRLTTIFGIDVMLLSVFCHTS